MPHIFISHTTLDDAFVRALQQHLNQRQINAWIDSRELRGGDALEPEILQAIDQAAALIAVVSVNSLQSAWLGKETEYAIQQDKKVIPLLLDGCKLGVLRYLFPREPVTISVSSQPGGLDETLPRILSALGHALPADPKPAPQPELPALAELTLELSPLGLETLENHKIRARAKAKLYYDPADPRQERVNCRESWLFTAPLGPIETEALRWYLETYAVWPGDVDRRRADRIAADLKTWGAQLYAAAMPANKIGDALSAWRMAGGAERRFSVYLDLGDLALPSPEEARQEAQTAATQLLGLPWELLHDGQHYLFQGASPVRVRRRLPNTHNLPAPPSALPIRVLLVTARPEDKTCAYIDHRASALPLQQALAALGERAELHSLQPPTLQALTQELARAEAVKQPYHIVHFDGHGVYNPHLGLGGLCFELEADAEQLGKRRPRTVYSDELGELLHQHRIPLVFLEACQTAQADQANESLAVGLLRQGVALRPQPAFAA